MKPFEFNDTEFPELALLFNKDMVTNTGMITDNNIQLFKKGMMFGEAELLKTNGFKKEYLVKNKAELYHKLAIDLSNTFWLGVKGSVLLSGQTPPNDVALTMNGVSNIMKDKGSLSIDCSKGNVFQALYQADRTHGIGEDNVMFCTPEYAKYIKRTVPLKRFRDNISFPENWKDRFMSIDFSKIEYLFTFRESPLVSKNGYSEMMVECKFSIQFDPSTSFSIQLR